MPVKGSTSRDANTSSGWLITPSLSEKPPAVSAVVKPDAARSEGPRTPLRHSDNAGPDTAVDEASAATCASGPEPSASAATPSPSTRHRLTPLHVTLLHLHFLYATRLILHIVRNSIATALIANPLPPPFAPAPTSASFAKRIGRLRWRISTIKKRCGASILASLTVTGGLLAFLVKAWSDDSGARGWNVVACAGWYGDLRLAEGVGAVKAGARGWAPLRNVVVLEVSHALIIAASTVLTLSSRAARQHSTPSTSRHHASRRRPRLDTFLHLGHLPRAFLHVRYLDSSNTLVPPPDRRFLIGHSLAFRNKFLDQPPSPATRPRPAALAPLVQLLDPHCSERDSLAA